MNKPYRVIKRHDGEVYPITLHQYLSNAMYDYKILKDMGYDVDVEEFVEGAWERFDNTLEEDK